MICFESLDSFAYSGASLKNLIENGALRIWISGKVSGVLYKPKKINGKASRILVLTYMFACYKRRLRARCSAAENFGSSGGASDPCEGSKNFILFVRMELRHCIIRSSGSHDSLVSYICVRRNVDKHSEDMGR